MGPSSPTAGCRAAQSCAGLLPEATISMKPKMSQQQCSEDYILADYSLSSHSYILFVSSYLMFPEAYSPMASHSVVHYPLFQLEVPAVTPRYARRSVSDRSWQQHAAVGINIGIKEAIGGSHYVYWVNNNSSHAHVGLGPPQQQASDQAYSIRGGAPRSEAPIWFWFCPTGLHPVTKEWIPRLFPPWGTDNGAVTSMGKNFTF